MTIPSAYGAFAYAYDKALGERFFKAAQRVLDDVMRRHPTHERTHLDLACGTGLAIAYFASQGWSSIGVDASMSMLGAARERAPRRLVCGDIRALPMRTTFSRVTCLYDSLNHLKNRADLVAAFRAARSVMRPDSLFLFDMNHPDVYPAIWGMKDPYVAEGTGWRLEIATLYRKRDATGIARVSGFATLAGGVKEPIRERHEQRAYSEREITDSLAEAGLAAIEVRDFDPYNESDTLAAEGVKLFFVCRAVS
ncbi:MAG: class I SAM-dependent methyltransferase [Thermoanaerobaculia bacterium]|nr:class I SAM-dependent methyltransferase [Thermoanaerobaculia bacterium]